jgi:endonuclease YncB( thermonuclease family)
MQGRRRQPRGYAVVAIGVVLGVVAVSIAASTDLPANLRSNWDTLAREVARLVAPPAVAVVPTQAPQTPLPEVTPTPAPSVIAPPLPDILPGPRAVEAVVTEVFDGNTIVVELNGTIERVRYLNVVIPSGTPDADAVAVEAARLNDSIVTGHTVLLEPDVSDTDDEGRLLRHVWVEEDGRFLLVGTWLVLSGVAETDFAEPDVAYKDVFMDAQDYARRQAIGIWGTPTANLPTTGPDTTPSPISSFRTYTSTGQVIVPEGTDLKLEGTLGRFVWRTVSFYSTQSTISWTVESTRRTGCQLDWFVEPSVGGAPTFLSIPITGERVVTGSQPLDSRAATASVIVESTCPEWTLRLRGLDQ